ncbi:menaquinone biosynthetic enzyme MqnA/MqnD family protein [Flavilitoribacter nigricans]|nr:menaquinone biosynthesis protein [Flavilitoribacter nigricans]
MTITAVSYLNTKPLLYGLLQSPIANSIDLSLDIPSMCAQKLLTGEADLGLVPVAVIPDIPNARIISDYCIGTNRYVKTVGIYADQPIETLTDLYLDHHSRTSVALSKVLLRDHWKLSPRLLPASDGYIDKIGGSVGGVVIGDRTIGLEERFAYFYDLGNAWYEFKQLPFVFAAWVSNRKIPDAFLQPFNEALKTGVEAIPQLMYLLNTPNDHFDLEQYFTKNINYELDAPKKQALEVFLGMLTGKPVRHQELVGL